jgi:hypothetical protein
MCLRHGEGIAAPLHFTDQDVDLILVAFIGGIFGYRGGGGQVDERPEPWCFQR